MSPIEDEELVGSGAGRGTAGAGRFEIVEGGVELGGALRNIEMKREHVAEVAAPGNGFAVGGEDEAGDVGDGAGRFVEAGKPFGVNESERAGGDGDFEIGVKNSERGLTGVNSKADGGGLLGGN